jgi:hypothetical protein
MRRVEIFTGIASYHQLRYEIDSEIDSLTGLEAQNAAGLSPEESTARQREITDARSRIRYLEDHLEQREAAGVIDASFDDHGVYIPKSHITKQSRSHQY